MQLRRVALASLALALAACGGEDAAQGVRPEWRLVRGEDGKEYRLVERGAYGIYYDLDNRLQRLEYDSNGDGRPDYVAHHDGSDSAHLLEVDTDYDGKIDRWEHYDPAGRLVKVGSSRNGRTEDLWAFLDDQGIPRRLEYDSDGDGRVDRAERFDAGRIVEVQVDADRDGRMDRWQDWTGGRLAAEKLDTDGDGKPDRRIRYGASGEVEAVEPL